LDFLERWFESDELKSTLATDGVIGAFASPSTPGTAYVLLHHVMGETFGRKGVWAYVRGGMGGITRAMARSFESRGGTIRVGARVSRILVRDGRAVGVVLSNGEEILARRVISNVDPKLTFLDMMEAGDLETDFREKVEQIRYRSATFKVNLALGGVPNWKACPNVGGRPGPQHHGTMHISPSMEYIEKAYDDARRGYVSESPILECTMASVLDPTVAPPGKHVMSIFSQYAPYEPKDGPWTESKKQAYTDRCIRLIDEYAPGFAGLVEGVHTLSPVDLEREYGLTGGNIFQGEMSLDRLFFMRPLPELARYRTPVRDLWMCGACTHPGGGVMGASGHNAAQEILREARL
jgi:phytoene dehydrogenase-like protein